MTYLDRRSEIRSGHNGYAPAVRMATPKAIDRPIRILLVDDDLDVLAIADANTPIQDTIFVTRQGGLAALQTLHEINYRVDVVITDLSMADMEGVELTKQIRKNEQLLGKERPIDIYWLTGWPPDETLLEIKDELGVKEWLEKPYDIVKIAEKVKANIKTDDIHLTDFA